MNGQSLCSIYRKNGDGEVFSFCNAVNGFFKKQNETKSGFASGSPGTPWRSSATSGQLRVSRVKADKSIIEVKRAKSSI
jgi:hypothetical protein